ncbi:MAG: pilus assembly protein TadG-related protein [Thermoguttaceae bacterium]|nr:pilus assembly protein TadG-related protein [Thermoguttaceae bacterium]MDW8077733.1 pilus assembly protein TadG-related protein [Thermoguttaceae bacterium]
MNWPPYLLRAVGRKCLARLRGLPADDRGVISVLTVFAILLLVMLLGYVMNVGRQVDSKIRLQNAADAAAFSGGVVLARAMNALAFTNHLLCEVFALTAFMREAYFRNSYEYFRPGNPLYRDRSIFSAWDKAGELLSRAPIPKFSMLGRAIRQKVPLEKQLVDAYSAWAYAASIPILPTLEMILAEELIPQYQQAVVAVFPEIAQVAAREIARQNSHPTAREEMMEAVLWRTDLQPVGGPAESYDRTLPVILPQEDTIAFNTARLRRARLANHYLNYWNSVTLRFFDREAKMSQFAELWRSFTCGYLDQLLNSEYPDRNLPAVLRPTTGSPQELEDDYTFVAIVYRPKLVDLAGSIFTNPLEGDSLAYAAVRLFVPQRRLVWWHTSGTPREDLGGIPGDIIIIDPGTPPAPSGPGHWEVRREPGVSSAWDLFNQRWRVQLVPATCQNLATLLRTPPPLPSSWAGTVDVPSLPGVDTPELLHISPH